MRRKLVAGNWKMHGCAADLAELTALTALLPADAATDVVICPPSSLLHRACQAVHGTAIAIGAQDCHAARTGAFTGDVSARMIADAGARHVIVGHSERRAAHGERDADIRAKAQAALAEGLTAIICIGETEDERLSGATLDRLTAQLYGSCPDTASAATTVIAYEPIWAIGTGRVPTLEQIAEVHDMLRAELVKRFGAEGEDVRLLYGGSVKPENAAEIFTCTNVDGALVGGASLRAADFAPIVMALQSR